MKSSFFSISTTDSQQLQLASDKTGKEANSHTPFFTQAPIQPKLTIGQRNDPYEQEADAVASQVVQQKPISSTIHPVAGNSSFFGQPKNIQAKCSHCEEKEERVNRKAMNDADVDGIDQSNLQAAGGQPLQKNVREEMEGSFGNDFSSVRIHNDSNAVEMNRRLNAHAFTHGSDIYFNSNRLDTSSKTGKHLLAHELTHVVQQTGGSGNTVQKDDKDTTTPDPAPKADPVYDQFIPTAALRFTLGEVIFVVPPEASFQAGPKMPQVLSIILKRLMGDQYNGELVGKLQKHLASKAHIEKFGYLKTNIATAGELIGGIVIRTIAFEEIIAFLDNGKHPWKFTDDEKKQFRLAYHNRHLRIDILKEAKEQGVRMPLWYSHEFYNRHMESFRNYLEEYSDLFEVHMAGHDPDSEQKGKAKIRELFILIETDITLMETIRQDTSLAVNPLCQLAYNAIWLLPDKKNLAKKPASLQSMSTALEFLHFARPKSEMVRDSETLDTVRVELLRLFQLENKIDQKDVAIIPPFPSLIVAPDLNPDNSTVTTAKNFFRMVTDFPKIYGENLLHGASIANKMDIYYSWNVFQMPDALKKMKSREDIATDQLVNASDEFVKNSSGNLTSPVETYKPDKDRDQTVSMKDIGIGDFIIAGNASPIYEKDMKRIQKPSQAGYPFSVFNAKDLAHTSAFGDLNAIEKLKAKAAKSEPKEKAELEKEILRLETREKASLTTITEQDLNDTVKMLKAARNLKKFIDDDIKQGLSYRGNKDTDPFIIRLKKYDELLYNVYLMIRQVYPSPKYGDLSATNEYIISLEQQENELKELKERSSTAYGSFKVGSPQFRVVAGLVKEDDGNLVPLIMVAGYHPDADPATGKYKIKLVDVTFKAPDPKKMVYVGDEKSNEKDAMHSVFKEFGEDNKYGDGTIIYRVPGTAYSGNVDSETTTWEYLQYAIAALGLVVLVFGVIASAGLLTPAAAAVVGALGIGLGVLGAIMSARNIADRQEKGTLEMDTETALDIVNIIAGVIVPIGAITRLSLAAKAATLARVISIQRLDKLLMIYDAVDFGANVYLISSKVKEDIEAVKQLGLPPHEEDNMIASITFDAVQQAAMMSVSAYGQARQLSGHFKSKVENTSYRSWEQKGWIKKEKNGAYNITAEAPPFLKKYETHAKLSPVEMHERARKEIAVETVETVKTKDGEHQLTLTEKGRIIRCSDFCTDLRLKYGIALVENPHLQKQLDAIEIKAKEAATSGNKVEAKNALNEAQHLEAQLQTAEDLRIAKTSAAAPPQDPKGSGTKPKVADPVAGPQKSIKERLDEAANIDEKIKIAEEDVARAQAEKKYYEENAKTAKDKLKKAKAANKKSLKGHAKVVAEQAHKEAEGDAKFADDLLNAAHEQETLAKHQASGFRQQNLLEKVDIARKLEEPVQKEIDSLQAQQNANDRKIRENLDKRDKARDYIRDESRKTQEDIIKKQEEIEKANREIDRLNKKTKELHEKAKAEKRKLAELEAITLKKIEALEAEKRAAKGITPAHYAYLRSKSPSDGIRKKYQLIKKDAVYDVAIEGTPHADHILSMNEITQMEGFSRLTTEQQINILNHPENFMALDGRVNSSKGDRNFSDWKGHPEFGDIPPAKRKVLMDQETKARAAIKKAIAEADPVKPQQ